LKIKIYLSYGAFGILRFIVAGYAKTFAEIRLTSLKTIFTTKHQLANINNCLKLVKRKAGLKFRYRILKILFL